MSGDTITLLLEEREPFCNGIDCSLLTYDVGPLRRQEYQVVVGFGDLAPRKDISAEKAFEEVRKVVAENATPGGSFEEIEWVAKLARWDAAAPKGFRAEAPKMVGGAEIQKLAPKREDDRGPAVLLGPIRDIASDAKYWRFGWSRSGKDARQFLFFLEATTGIARVIVRLPD